MKKTIFIAAFCLVVSLLYAQITTDEQPYGLKRSLLFSKEKTEEILFTPDKKAIEQEDFENDKASEPLRFAYAVHVDYDIQNSGSWYNLSDGSKIWRLSVVLPNALSTNAYYRKFWLPEGGKFFVYNKETGQSIGAITSEYIGGSKEYPIAFATALIYGENVTFEYYHPASAKDLPEITIFRIDYGYRFVDNPYRVTVRDFGDANSCHVNINCQEGAGWQNEKRAIARVKVYGPDGSGWCSCALVNNTSYNYIPYVLTADHCLLGLDAINDNNAGLWTFYWDFEYPGCVNGVKPVERSTTGATVIANNPNTDFALLRLTQNPSILSGITPYYLGWDHSGNCGTSGIGIHHPRGDVKKICQMDQIYSNNYTLPIGGAPQTHWVANIYKGFTEPGSSGSPQINSSRRVVGQLHGSEVYDFCTSKNAFYGRFDISWTGNGATDSRRKLQPWLDPIRSGVIVLDGSYCKAPIESNISVTSGLYDANSRIYRATASCLGATKFEWKTLSSGWTIRNAEAGSAQTMHDVLITPNSSSAPSTSLAVRAYNNCGWCEWILVDRISYNLTYSISTAPNPVSNTLNVNITVNDPQQEQYSSVAEVLGIQQHSTINTGSSGTIQMQTSFIIRLYSSFGALVLQTTLSADNPNTQLDVSGLPSGVYYLHVTDGVGGEPQTSTIVVKH